MDNGLISALSLRLISFLCIIGFTIQGFYFSSININKKLYKKELLEGVSWYVTNEVVYFMTLDLLSTRFVQGTFMNSLYTHYGFYLNLPLWAGIILNVIIMDICLYSLHRTYHAVPILWKFHSIHHCTKSIDPLTNNRYSWVELFMTSVVLNFVVSFLLNSDEAGFYATLVFTVQGYWGHTMTNTKWLEKNISWLFNTPQIHALHHVIPTNKQPAGNYGACLVIWDKLFGSFIGDTYNDGEIGAAGGCSTGFSFFKKFFYQFRVIAAVFVKK